MLLMCVVTVCSDTPSRSATREYVQPLASSRTMSASRGVRLISPFQPQALIGPSLYGSRALHCSRRGSTGKALFRKHLREGSGGGCRKRLAICASMTYIQCMSAPKLTAADRDFFATLG